MGGGLFSGKGKMTYLLVDGRQQFFSFVNLRFSISLLFEDNSYAQ